MWPTRCAVTRTGSMSPAPGMTTGAALSGGTRSRGCADGPYSGRKLPWVVVGGFQVKAGSTNPASLVGGFVIGRRSCLVGILLPATLRGAGAGRRIAVDGIQAPMIELMPSSQIALHSSSVAYVGHSARDQSLLLLLRFALYLRGGPDVEP